MKLGLHTFSYRYPLKRGDMDLFAFIARTDSLGLDGVKVSVGPGAPSFGHLGSDDQGFLREVRAEVERRGMFIEIDTRGTEPDFLTRMLKLCGDLGADVLRIYAPPQDDLSTALGAATDGFRAVVSVCADLGVHIAFENHEYETSEEVLGVVRAVASEWVGTLVDTGNSMMVWEEPIDAVRTMAPYAVSSHFKEHVVFRDGSQTFGAGVTQGQGSTDCVEAFRILAQKSPLRRVNIEVCYGYRAPFRRSPDSGAGAVLGQGAFRVYEPPFDPKFIPTPALELRAHLDAWQDQSVMESVAFVKRLNEKYG